MEKTELEKKMESEMGEGRPVAAPLVTEMKTKAVVPFGNIEWFEVMD